MPAQESSHARSAQRARSYGGEEARRSRLLLGGVGRVVASSARVGPRCITELAASQRRLATETLADRSCTAPPPLQEARPEQLGRSRRLCRARRYSDDRLADGR